MRSTLLCLATACTGTGTGVTATDVTATSPSSLVAAPTGVYWTEPNATSGYTVYTATLSGHNAHVVMPTQDVPSNNDLRTAGSGTYWTANSALWWIDGDTQATAIAAMEGWQQGAWAAAGGSVYFATGSQLVRQPFTSPSSQLVPITVTWLAVLVAQDGYVYYQDANGLARIAIDGSGYKVLAPISNDVVDFLAVRGSYAYFKTERTGIWRAAVDGTGARQVVVLSPSTDATGYVTDHARTSVAIDDIESTIFWSNVVSSDGWPSGMATNLTLGTFRANADGTNASTVGPAGSALKIVDGRAFWLTKDNAIVSTALDGSELRTHYTHADGVIGPAIVNGKIYAFAVDAAAATSRLVIVEY
jgi:hypothetical protein